MTERGVEQRAEVADRFVGWQCRLRQHVVRRGDGRPSPGMRPELTLHDGRRCGPITTLLVKADPAEAIARFRHIVQQTHEPSERYEAAIAILQTAYYQYPREFSDQLTALFNAGSAIADALQSSAECTLDFREANQRYRVVCASKPLTESEPFHLATYWHNAMFNPNRVGPVRVVRFIPDWSRAITALD